MTGFHGITTRLLRSESVDTGSARLISLGTIGLASETVTLSVHKRLVFILTTSEDQVVRDHLYWLRVVFIILEMDIGRMRPVPKVRGL